MLDNWIYENEYEKITTKFVILYIVYFNVICVIVSTPYPYSMLLKNGKCFKYKLINKQRETVYSTRAAVKYISFITLEKFIKHKKIT